VIKATFFAKYVYAVMNASNAAVISTPTVSSRGTEAVVRADRPNQS